MYSSLQKIYGFFIEQLFKAQFSFRYQRAKYNSHILCIFGVFLIVIGLESVSHAVVIDQPYDPAPDAMLWNATCRVLNLMSTSFGGLMVTASGVIAIVSAAFGAFKAASAMIVTGATAFILRDLVDLYFPLRNCRFDFSDGDDDAVADPCIITGICD